VHLPAACLHGRRLTWQAAKRHLLARKGCPSIVRAPTCVLAEIKNYYNDITYNNLDLIKTLKEDVAEMKKREAQNEKLMYEIAQENKRLSEPLSKALKEVETLRGALALYDKDKASLAHTKVRYSERRVIFRAWMWWFREDQGMRHTAVAMK
jgi:predicted nuclease with TOPRIM domain